MQTLTSEIAGRLGVKRTQRVVVMQVEQGPPAAEAGLQPGDILVEVDQKPVRDVPDFERLTAQGEKDGNLLLLIDRDGTTIFLTLAL